MEEKKLSDQKESTASDNAEAVNLSTLDNEDKLKKLSSFSGTIEISLPIGRQDEKQQENLSFSKFDDISADEFKDFEDLLWGGNMPDAPVLNFGDEYVVTEGETLEDGKKQSDIDEIIQAIRTVEDPELMLNVYDLGLIYRLDKLKNGDVEIDMTVTAPSCPVAGVMPKQVAQAVSKLEGTGKVTVKLVWEPVWTIDKMTDEAKYILNMF